MLGQPVGPVFAFRLAYDTMGVSRAPTATPLLPLLKQVERGEEKWKKRGVTSYCIEVRVSRSTWRLQTHRIVVRNGQVVESSATCDPAPAELGTCEVEPFDAQDYANVSQGGGQ